MKKVFGIILSVIMLAAMSFGLASCGGGKDANTFDVFLYKGNTKYDTDFKQNAVAEYLATKEWAGVKLTINYMVPPKSSSAAETMQTLIASGNYPDVIDYYALSTQTLQELYEDGVIMDITEYVTKYMPNYVAYLQANPDIAYTATKEVDGEKKYLSICKFADQPYDNCWCYSYRRDWILEYGVQPENIMVDAEAPWKGTVKNPNAGEKFNGGYDESGDWSDDVIFPNGTNVPMYLSDWVWMFEIFDKARTELKLLEDPNSYNMSISYSGVETLGALPGAFNVASGFYIDNDNVVQSGISDERMRVYFDVINIWYEKGWIDKEFYTRSNDAAYMINTAAYSSGKVGLWYGQLSFFGDAIRDEASPYLKNAYVMAARPVLNDVYATDTNACFKEDNQFENNYCFCFSKFGGQFVVSTAAAGKNLEALFTQFDYMYTEEGAYLQSWGLNEEQQAEIQNELYIEHGITSAYEYVYDEEGNQLFAKNGLPMMKWPDKVLADYNLQCIAGGSFFGRIIGSNIYTPRAEYLQLSYSEMMNYEGSGHIQDELIGLLSAELAAKYADVSTYMRTAQETIQYRYVTGDLDALNDEDWKISQDVYDKEYKNGQTYREAIEEIAVALNDILDSM